jgi:hypothetical protein
MQRRNIVDYRRQARSGLGGGGGGGGPAPFIGVIDSIVAAGGAVPNAASSISHRLYAAYTGPLFRVRRASDAAELNIGYGGDNRVDEAAIAAHCSGTTGTIVTVYDQSGSARDVTQATTGAQPIIYTGGAIAKVGSLPWVDFGAGTRFWARGDSAGITGTTSASIVHFTTAIGGTAYAEIGTFSSNLYFGAWRNGANIRTSIAGSTANVFTVASAIATPSLLVHRLVGGADIAATTARQNGVDLSSSATGSGTTSIGASGLTIGARLNGSAGIDGGGCFWLFTAQALTGSPLTAIETFGTSLRTIAGV